MLKLSTVMLVLCLILATVSFAADNASDSSAAEGDTETALAAIAGQGLMNSHAFEFLTELSDDIGARVTGSPAAAKAIEWGAAKMKHFGLQNVHAEPWKISRGWTRGLADAELLEPIRRKLSVDAMGWVGSTPPAARKPK
jgi:hypothetical protein